METTINIHSDVLEKITLAAKLQKTSRFKLIITLIKETMNDISDPGQFGTLVTYQKRSNPGDWHIFHIQLRMDDYEYLLDLRKLLKMSVSLILSYAVKKYLKKIFSCNRTDNYRYRNYVIIKDIIDNIICWKFIWGYPPNIAQILPDTPASIKF